VCYTCGVIVCLGKQRLHVTAQRTATHRTVLCVIRRDDESSHKVFMDNYFTSPALLDDLFQRKINACETVCHESHGLPKDIGPKSRKMESEEGGGGGSEDVVARVRGNLRAARWRDTRDVYILTRCTLHRRIWSCFQT